MDIAVSMWSLVSYYERGSIDVPSFVRYAAQIGAHGVELLDVFGAIGKRKCRGSRRPFGRPACR